jgi:anti-sigma B factor antagonist
VDVFEVRAALDEEAGDDRSHRVVARGELDIDSAPLLAAELDRLVQAGALLVVLDASEIDFVDSSGLRTIVMAGNALQEGGGRLLISGMSPAMASLLEVSGLIDRFRSDQDQVPDDGPATA